MFRKYRCAQVDFAFKVYTQCIQWKCAELVFNRRGLATFAAPFPPSRSRSLLILFFLVFFIRKFHSAIGHELRRDEVHATSDVKLLIDLFILPIYREWNTVHRHRRQTFCAIAKMEKRAKSLNTRYTATAKY